jgi:hypothetical protein
MRNDQLEKMLNLILRDDLEYIDGLQWCNDIERVSRKLDRKINAALSEADAGVYVAVRLDPARITVQ